MPTIFSHAIAAAALSPGLRRELLKPKLWLLGAACAVAPDLDVLAFNLGIPYEHPLGHRGFTHSLAFAGLLAFLVVALFYRHERGRRVLWAYFFAATASHGLLDMLTDGGMGVALFSPLSNARLFLPWQPIEVSPLGVSRFFSERGVEVIASELIWIWLPSLVTAVALHLWRRRTSSSTP